eukprot:m.135069 g.135069  ORF g.135069 m.135069 type:complete len:386 (+) comp15838_c0_seq1:245-1402(+)
MTSSFFGCCSASPLRFRPPVPGDLRPWKSSLAEIFFLEFDDIIGGCCCPCIAAGNIRQQFLFADSIRFQRDTLAQEESTKDVKAEHDALQQQPRRRTNFLCLHQLMCTKPAAKCDACAAKLHVPAGCRLLFESVVLPALPRLFYKAVCCPTVSVMATREALRRRRRLMLDPCDNRIQRCDNYVDICYWCTRDDKARAAVNEVQPMGLAAYCMYCCVFPCLQAQVRYELSHKPLRRNALDWHRRQQAAKPSDSEHTNDGAPEGDENEDDLDDSTGDMFQTTTAPARATTSDMESQQPPGAVISEQPRRATTAQLHRFQVKIHPAPPPPPRAMSAPTISLAPGLAVTRSQSVKRSHEEIVAMWATPLPPISPRSHAVQLAHLPESDV